ncbi:FHA domain-containing protein [Kosakonia cowanii]|uniref:FHA domain-containing protein n=1 Tax=Kosakonia cowanii TaxID=208223 RepID=UPI002DDD4B06|nr:FHA domain-containing protein [Kosakonia cowanii]WRY59523.1 FHA domain-containing protein [Kosakonia cowanii]
MFELRVLSGLHLGAALPLFGDKWLIGQADEADLMLSDARVAPRACELRREETQWLAQPESGDAFSINIESPFQVADVWLCVARIDTPWAACLPPATPPAPEGSTEAPPQAAPPVAASKGFFTRGIRTLAWSLMLLLTLTVTSWVLQPTVAQTQVASSTPQSTPAELQAPLQKMLRERDLAKVVKLDMHNQRLRLTGRLSKSQMQIFNRMLERFNATYTSATPLDNQVKLLKVSLPFRIVQITTGSRANIVTDDGQRLFVGDEVDHLRLVSITSDQIEFNGRDNIKVSW